MDVKLSSKVGEPQPAKVFDTSVIGDKHLKDNSKIEWVELEGNVVNIKLTKEKKESTEDDQQPLVPTPRELSFEYSFMKGSWFEDDHEKGEQFKIISKDAKNPDGPVALFLKMGNP